MDIVNSLNDIMSYFHFVFVAYIIMFIIIILNFCKVLYIRKKFPGGNCICKLIQRVDLVIDILCGIAMAGGLMFQGVLADNNALVNSTWGNALLIISILSLIIFILDIIMGSREI